MSAIVEHAIAPYQLWCMPFLIWVRWCRSHLTTGGRPHRGNSCAQHDYWRLCGNEATAPASGAAEQGDATGKESDISETFAKFHWVSDQEGILHTLQKTAYYYQKRMHSFRVFMRPKVVLRKCPELRKASTSPNFLEVSISLVVGGGVVGGLDVVAAGAAI